MSRQHIPCPLLSLEHDGMYRADTFNGPTRRVASKKRTLRANVFAVEERFAAVHGFDNFEYRNVFGRPSQCEAPADPLSRDHDPGLLQLGEQFCDELRRNFLQSR
jgi:hypothetical protein